jgi:hypothetical protein
MSAPLLRTAALAAAALPLAAAGPAEADPARAAQADERPDFQPTFTLKGTSTGESTLQIGLDWLRRSSDPASADDETHVKLSLEAASHDGLSTLLSLDASGVGTESALTGTLEATHTVLQRTRRLHPTDIDALTVAQRKKLLADCQAERGWQLPLVPGADGTLHPADLANDADVDEIAPDKFCTSGQHALTAAERYPLPARQLWVAFSAGRDTSTQLSLTDAATMTFHPTTTRKPRAAMQLGYAAYDPGTELTQELAGSLGLASTAAASKARWCTPAGSVIRADGSASDPAETCRELPLGDPVRTTTLAASAHLGVVGRDYAWRAALGPTATFGLGGDRTTFQIGIEAPFYLVRGSAEFQGIVKVTPMVLLTRDASGVDDTQALLTITLLGARTLFETAFH